MYNFSTFQLIPERQILLEDALVVSQAKRTCQLLSPDVQWILLHVSMIRAAFTLECALALVDDMQDEVVLACLAQLCANGLLVVTAVGDTQEYCVPNTTRHFAYEKCALAGECQSAHRRHALLCCEWVCNAEAEWAALPTAAWRARYLGRLSDIRAALRWAFNTGGIDERFGHCLAVDKGDAAIGARLMAHSRLIWIELALLAEQRDWICLALPNASCRQDELHLQLALGNALFHLNGTPGAFEKAIAAFARAFQLAGEIGDIVMQARAYSGLCAAQLLDGEYQVARTTGAAFDFFLERKQSPVARLIHDRVMALTLHFCGDQVRAGIHAERACRQLPLSRHATHNSGVHYDERVTALTILARIRWLQGFPQQALALAREAIAHALRIDHPVSLCHALAMGACPVALWTGDTASAADFTALLSETSHRYALAQWQSWARQYAAHGSTAAAPAVAGLPPLAPGPLAETMATISAHHAAPVDFERAEHGLSGWCSPELLRLKGKAMLRAGAPAAAVEQVYRRSLTLAESQSALAWQLRTATSLAQLLKGQRHSGAQLETLYRRFSEGFAGRDLLAARGLLAQLGRTV